jgi:hypothetical protein
MNAATPPGVMSTLVAFTATASFHVAYRVSSVARSHAVPKPKLLSNKAKIAPNRLLLSIGIDFLCLT